MATKLSTAAKREERRDRVMALTDKQKRFVEEYIVDLNATQAAIRAGYSKKTARQAGAENLSKPVIQTVLKAAMDAQSKRTKISADAVLAEYARIAFADIRDAVEFGGGTVTIKASSELPDDVAAALSEVSRTAQGLRVKFHSKIAALEALARHMGLFNDKLHVGGELSVKPDLAAFTDADLRQLRAMIATGKAEQA